MGVPLPQPWRRGVRGTLLARGQVTPRAAGLTSGSPPPRRRLGSDLTASDAPARPAGRARGAGGRGVRWPLFSLSCGAGRAGVPARGELEGPAPRLPHRQPSRGWSPGGRKGQGPRHRALAGPLAPSASRPHPLGTSVMGSGQGGQRVALTRTVPSLLPEETHRPCPSHLSLCLLFPVGERGEGCYL